MTRRYAPGWKFKYSTKVFIRLTQAHKFFTNNFFLHSLLLIVFCFLQADPFKKDRSLSFPKVSKLLWKLSRVGILQKIQWISAIFNSSLSTREITDSFRQRWNNSNEEKTKKHICIRERGRLPNNCRFTISKFLNEF